MIFINLILKTKNLKTKGCQTEPKILNFTILLDTILLLKVKVIPFFINLESGLILIRCGYPISTSIRLKILVLILVHSVCFKFNSIWLYTISLRLLERCIFFGIPISQLLRNGKLGPISIHIPGNIEYVTKIHSFI